MDSTILSENLTTTSQLLSLNITNPFDQILSNETKVNSDSEIETVETNTETETETDSDDPNITNWSFNTGNTNPVPSNFPSLLHINNLTQNLTSNITANLASNLTSTTPVPPPPPPLQVTINTHSSSLPPIQPPTYPPPPQISSISQPILQPIEISNNEILSSSISNISQNLLSLLTSSSNTLDGFSPEEVEESVLPDSDDDTDTDNEMKTATRTTFLPTLISLPDKHFSLSIVWDFELNYDYYKIQSANFYPVCRSINYRRKKLQIDRFNNVKNMKIGKYWEFPNSDKFTHGHYLYFIIYFMFKSRIN